MSTSPDFTSPPYRVDRDTAGPCFEPLAAGIGAPITCELPAGHEGAHRSGHTTWTPVARLAGRPQWWVDHPRDQLGNGGLTAYPSETDARTAAGITGRVLALVPAEAVDVLTAARDWAATEDLPAHLLDDQERALRRAVAALDRQETR